MAKNPSDKVNLRSSDGDIFEVEKAVAEHSATIAAFLADGDEFPGELIPLPNVNSGTLAKVIEYCAHHAGEKEVDFDFNPAEHFEFDHKFIKVDQNTIFDLIEAADYLNIKGLLELGCRAIADLMEDKTVEEIRKIFHVENDYTPEEEAEVRRENEWAFENY